MKFSLRCAAADSKHISRRHHTRSVTRRPVSVTEMRAMGDANNLNVDRTSKPGLEGAASVVWEGDEGRAASHRSADAYNNDTANMVHSTH